MTGWEKLKALLVSRRFLAAAATVIAIVTNHYGLELSAEQLLAFVGIVGSWILGDSWQKTGTTPVDSLPDVVVTEAVQRVKARGQTFSGRPM